MVRTQGRFRSFASHALAVPIAILLCAGCQDGYPIPASQCDEWCEASRPELCASYDPAACVLTCNQRGGDAPECRSQLDVLLSCIHGKTDDQLACKIQFETGIYHSECNTEEFDFENCAARYALYGYGSFNWL